MTGVFGPRNYPEAILNNKAYEMFPADPVTTTLFGAPDENDLTPY